MVYTNHILKVCIPGLHLSLGIFNQLFTPLEDACKQLDLKMPSAESGAGGVSFERYSGALQKLSDLCEKLTLTAQKTTCLTQLAMHLLLSTPEPQQSPAVRQAWGEAAIAQRELDAVVGGMIQSRHACNLKRMCLRFVRNWK